MRVLLVEDDADMAASLKASLAADDHEVEIAGDGELGMLRSKYEIRIRQHEAALEEGSEAQPQNGAAPHPLRRALEAERHTLSDLRTRGVIGDDAFHRVEEELDWAELNAGARMA